MKNKSLDYPHVLEEIYGTPWMITEPYMKMITDVLERKMNGESLSAEELNLIAEMREGNTSTFELPDKPSVGVLGIKGSLFPRANLMSSMSGGQSIQELRGQFKQMVESDTVESILLQFNTPGGKVDMIAEFANDIFEARGTKPIIASVDSLCCSAGYYLAAQCDEIYSTPSGITGSIGVIGVHKEDSKAQEARGITTTVFTAGQYKGIGNSDEPLTSEDKALMQEQLDESYTDFIEAVAKGRAVETEYVLENYGKGLTYKSKKALSRGMIDGIETFDKTLERMTSSGKSVSIPKVDNGGNEMPELSAEVLEALGLTPEATDEELNTAILGLNAELTPLRALKNVVSTQTEFAKMFPQQAAEMAALKESNLSSAAKMFSESYAKFTRKDSDTEFGFTALALENIADMHLALAKGDATQDQFKAVLDLVATDDAIVQYGEIGSKRGQESVVSGDTSSDMQAFADKISEVCERDNVGWDEAVPVAASENPELAEAYYSTYSPKR